MFSSVYRLNLLLASFCSLIVLGQCTAVRQENGHSFIQLCSVDDISRLDSSISFVYETVKKFSPPPLPRSEDDDSLTRSQLDEIREKVGLMDELKRDAWDLRRAVQAQSNELNTLYKKLNGVSTMVETILNVVQTIQPGLNVSSFQENTKTVLVDPVSDACYGYGHGFEPVNCRWCFARFFESKSWRDALEQCQQLNATLLVIDSATKQEAVKKWLHYHWGYDRYWTGGYSVDDQWKWAADNQDFVYNHWSEGQPSHLEEECLDLVRELDFKWNDMVCSYEQPYICEKFFL